MEEVIKPCPHCGSKKITTANTVGYTLGCLECYCCGPLASTVELAIKAWNKRS